jgi:hypothetical protein
MVCQRPGLTSRSDETVSSQDSQHGADTEKHDLGVACETIGSESKESLCTSVPVELVQDRPEDVPVDSWREIMDSSLPDSQTQEYEPRCA